MFDWQLTCPGFKLCTEINLDSVTCIRFGWLKKKIFTEELLFGTWLNVTNNTRYSAEVNQKISIWRWDSYVCENTFVWESSLEIRTWTRSARRYARHEALFPIYYSFTIHLLFIYYLFTIHLLFIYYLFTIHLLFIYYLFTIYLLFIYYSFTIHLLFIVHYPLTRQTFLTDCRPNYCAVNPGVLLSLKLNATDCCRIIVYYSVV